MRDKGTVSDYFYIDNITIKAKEAVATTPVTFTHINSSWNDNTETLANGTHYTVLHLDGLLTSGYLGQGDDWSGMNATINGGTSYFNFSPASYIAGPNLECNYIILYSATAPTEGDVFTITAGSTFKVGGDDTNVYELVNDISLKFNGTAWEVYNPNEQPPVEPPVIEPTETVSVTFTNVNTTVNNWAYEGFNCTFLHFDGGISGNGGLDGNYGDLLAKMTVNNGAVNTENVSFVCPNWIGAEGGIVLRFVTNPESGTKIVLPAGATFTIGGGDTNVYQIAADVYLQFNGTAWEVYDPNAQPPVDPEPEVPPVDPEPTEPMLVTFTHINTTVNNWAYEGFNCTFLHFDGGIGANGGLDGDYSDLLSKMTINDGAVDAENVSFICPNWMGAEGGIVLRFVTNPESDTKIMMPAGATFTIGGEDTNVYKLVNDISLKFNGTAWEVYDPNAQPPVDPEPEVPPVDPEPTEPVLVTFTQINSAWNNNVETLNNGRYYTVLHLEGLAHSGYLGQGDDWSGMNATINGGESYFNFSPASYIAGPDKEGFNYIIIYSATAPTEGDVFTVMADSTFKVGGADTNVYKLTHDISLKFNGTAWEVYDPNEQPPVDPPVIEPTEKASVTLTGANGVWNNFDYTDQGYFCTFLHFEGGIGGGGLDGDFSNLLSNVTLNGQPLDTENVSFVCARWIGWENGIILRFKTLPQENSILVFPAGTTFTVGGEDANVYEISETMELKMKNGKWNIPLPTAEFIGVNAWNNNIVTLAGSRLTILDFDVTAMGNAVSTDKNLIAMAGVSINGVKLTDIDGASITYMHGDNHMGIDIPASAIYPTQEYPITILKVAAGTVFENYELPEITLSLIGGTWVVGEFETMPEEDEYVTISDITGEERVELGSEGLMSAMDGFAGDVNFKFVYRSDEAIMNYAPYGGLAVYLNSTNSWDGWRIFFVGNVVYVYDATMGGVGDEHVLLGQAEFGIASSFEMQIEISVKQVGGKYSIVIGGSCVKILELNDITPIGDCIGGGISLYSATRSCSVKDYKYGDVFDPVLTINSKQEIVMNEGEAVPEIDATAVDGLTEITPTYVWDEGAITDGKMNVGVWNCVVTATDANGNYATATVRVTVKGEAKYMVTFDGANEGEYAYGEKIVKPADPTKEATEKYQYTFDGWYNGDEKWDFDHDIVTSDVALVAKFIESDVYYKVAVTVSSETQTIYVTYGAQVDLSVFDKEGFEKEVKQNGEVITKLSVTEDTAIEITYTQSASNTPSGCAGGCAGSLTGVGGIGVLLTLIGGGMLMRKKEETDEK